MRLSSILLASLMLAGCATQPMALLPPTHVETPLVREAPATHDVETRYEVRSYRDASDADVRHEAHAIYRVTRVPARVAELETEPRGKFAPVSYAPLPPSEELAAELAAQKEITARMRTIREQMATVERQAQSQYGTLLDQTGETLKLRRQLEDERARARELEARAHERVTDRSTTNAAAAAKPESNW
jgi:hypothetical protein